MVKHVYQEFCVLSLYSIHYGEIPPRRGIHDMIQWIHAIRLFDNMNIYDKNMQTNFMLLYFN